MPISFGVVIGDWLFNKDSTHSKDKKIHIGKHSKIILHLLKFDFILNPPKKCFNPPPFLTFSIGHPMCKFKTINVFF
jgi:hypothetical protein